MVIERMVLANATENMPIQTVTDSNVQAFLRDVDPFVSGYRHATLSYITISHDGYDVVLRGRLELSVEPIVRTIPELEVAGLRVLRRSISMSFGQLREVIDSLLGSSFLPFPDGHLKLLRDSARGSGCHHERWDTFYQRTNSYGCRLVLNGTSPWPSLNKVMDEIDRGLRTRAFDSLDELLAACDFDRLSMIRESTFEIIVGPVAVIERDSTIKDGIARLVVRLAAGLNIENFAMTLRNAVPREAVMRQAVNSSEFKWVDEGNYVSGNVTVKVPRDIRFECRALYGGIPQDQRVLVDPLSMPNPRRLVLEITDPGLRKLEAVLTEIGERDDKRRNEFEADVAVLFYLLGFDTVRVGASRRKTDGPDIYARAGNELWIVECTSGAFGEEKCAKLSARAKQVREVWAKAYAGIQPVQIEEVVVTARPRSELVPQLMELERQGVLILCREEIKEAIEWTDRRPMPSDVLRSLRQRALWREMAGGLSGIDG